MTRPDIDDLLRPKVVSPEAVDLSATTDELPASVRGRLWSLFGSIPGVSVLNVSSTPVGQGFAEACVLVRGWSPSLHAVNATFTAMSSSAGPPGSVAQAFELDMRHWYGEQLLRSEAAAARGLVEPLPTAQTAPFETRHLMVDRSLAPLAAALGEDLPQSLKVAVRTLHLGDPDYHGGPMLASGDTAVVDSHYGPVVSTDVVIDATPGRWIQWDGVTLKIAGRELPETACVQAVGRRLREVADVHPVLADRIVSEVRNTRDSDRHPVLHVMLVHDVIPFDAMAEEVARWRDA